RRGTARALNEEGDSASRQRQRAQGEAPLFLADDEGAGVVELGHLVGAGVILRDGDAVTGAAALGALGANAPDSIFIDLHRLLEQSGIDAGDPIGAWRARQRRFVLGDADEDILLAPLFVGEHAARRIALAEF